MFSRTVHSRIQFLLACLIAFLLPFKQLGPLQIVALSIAMLLLNWLLEGDFKNKFSAISHPGMLVLYLAFYGWHVLGLGWTTNLPAGYFDLEVKLSLFVCPWIFSTRPFRGEQVDRVLGAFVLGCGVASLVLLVRAVYFWFFLHENKFFYEAFSSLMHPSYFSMYLNMAIISLLLAFSKKGNTLSKGWLFLFPLFVIVVVLLSSKMGLIGLLLIIMVWLCWLVVSKRRYLLGGGVLFLLAAGIWSIFQFSPAVSVRIKSAVSAVSSGSSDKTNAESTAVRMLIWGSAREVIAEHPLVGAGTGDSKEVLMEKYKEEGITGAYKKNLNAHNAYLQIWVALGGVGLLLLLALLVLPVRIGWMDKKPAVICFTLLLALNFIPESMLETEAGVMYYGFFGCLLLFSAPGLDGLSLPWKQHVTEPDVASNRN